MSPTHPASIKRAIYARKEYFLKSSATLTMKLARRLIERDLALDERALDAHKETVSKYVDRVLASALIRSRRSRAG